MRATISSRLIGRIVTHAAHDHPSEACGLLLGTGTRIEDVIASPNVAADPNREFEIDPGLLLRVHREARGQGRQLVGWYHSHPNGVAEPSVVDALRAIDDGKLWLIVASGQVRAFVSCASGPVHGRFAPVELSVLD